MSLVQKTIKTLIPYREKAVLANFLLGWAEAVPLTLIIGVLGYWLADVGVDKKTIGIFALVSSPYALKFAWAPLLDRLSLGALTKKWGRRRGWLFVVQALMALCMLGMAASNPSEAPLITGVFAFIIGVLSASQDIIIDAYRIEIMKRHQYGHGATMLTFGYRAAGLTTGAAALFMADVLPWALVLSLAPILLIPGIVAVLWVGEPEDEGLDYIKKEDAALKLRLDAAGIRGKSAEVAKWINDAVVLPFKEFMTRRGWLMILLFILTFKAADAVVAIMTAPFLTEMGFTKTEIATASKTVGGVMTWVGVFAGSILYASAGLYRSLMITAVLMMVTNFMYLWVAAVGNDTTALAYTVAAESFASGLGNVAVIAFLSSLTNRAFTATQYALLSSVSNVARAAIGSISGFVATAVGWAEFFIISAAMALPSILILWLCKKYGWGDLGEARSKTSS